MYRFLVGAVLVLSTFYGGISPAFAQGKPPISVAVAANFAAPLKALLPEFEQVTGHAVRVTVSSSGSLYAQIEHGAPYDLFLSADSMRPQALVTSGRVNAKQVMTYAEGRLALVGVAAHINDAMLREPGTRLAIAEPDLAPYGRAARQMLLSVGLWTALENKVIRGSNIQQTLQFWQTGNVDAALIAASQCAVYALPCKAVPTAYEPIIQQLAILSDGDSGKAATQLASYLRSSAAQQKLVEMGYKPLTSALLKAAR